MRDSRFKSTAQYREDQSPAPAVQNEIPKQANQTSRPNIAIIADITTRFFICFIYFSLISKMCVYGRLTREKFHFISIRWYQSSLFKQIDQTTAKRYWSPYKPTISATRSPCLISFIFMQFSAKMLANNRFLPQMQDMSSVVWKILVPPLLTDFIRQLTMFRRCFLFIRPLTGMIMKEYDWKILNVTKGKTIMTHTTRNFWSPSQ